MTEAEWLTDTDCLKMINHAKGGLGERRLRLLNCALCRCIGHRLALNEPAIKTVERCEILADDIENNVLRMSLRESTREVFDGIHGYRRFVQEERTAAEAVVNTGSIDRDFDYSANAPFVVMNVLNPTSLMRNAQVARIIREVIGNPFRPVTVEPSWLTFDVHALASGIYEKRAFDRMPILADALMDAGCDNEDVLNHCRSGGVHVRGCWVVDLILGKS